MLKLALAQHYHFTPHQLVALGLLAAKGPLRFKELRLPLAVPKSTLTFLVDTLERRGLVRRKRAPHDRRQWMVVLTPRGVELSRDIYQCEAASLEPLLGLLDKDEGVAQLPLVEPSWKPWGTAQPLRNRHQARGNNPSRRRKGAKRRSHA